MKLSRDNNRLALVNFFVFLFFYASQFLKSPEREKRRIFVFSEIDIFVGKGSTFFAVGQDNKKCGKAWIMLPATTFVVFTKDSMPFNSLPKSDKSHQFQMLKIAASVFM